MDISIFILKKTIVGANSESCLRNYGSILANEKLGRGILHCHSSEKGSMQERSVLYSYFGVYSFLRFRLINVSYFKDVLVNSEVNTLIVDDGNTVTEKEVETKDDGVC